MSRDFTKSTANYMSLGVNALSSLLSGAGIVCGHAWVWIDTFDAVESDDKILTIIHDGANEGLTLLVAGPSPVVEVQGRSETGEALRSLAGSSPVPTGQWVSVGFRCDFVDDTDNAVFLNGVSDNAGTMYWDTTAYRPGVPTLDDRIGSHPGGVQSQWFDGRIAEVTLWNGDIGNDGFAALAKGWHPPEVSRPVCYFPLIADESSSIILLDNFTDTNGVSLDAHTMGVGSGWTEQVGSWDIQSNRANHIATSGAQATADAGTANVSIDCTLNSPTSGGYGLMLRYQDSTHHWLAYAIVGGAFFYLYERNGGWTLRDSAACSLSASTDYIMTAAASGNDLSATINGISVSYTSSLFNTETEHGIYANIAGMRFDDFECTGPSVAGFRDAYGSQTATITGTIAKAAHPPMRVGIWVPQWFGNSITLTETPPGGFNPADYGRPIWDMDAALGVEVLDGVPCANGDSVKTWRDQSTTGADYEQVPVPPRPLWFDNVVNGHPVVRFNSLDGPVDYLTPLTMDHLGNYTSLTMLWVLRSTEAINSGTIFHQRTATREMSLYHDRTTERLQVNIWDGGVKMVENAVAGSTWIVATISIVQNDLLRMWINNGSLQSTAIGALSSSNPGSPYAIFGADNIDFDISRSVVYRSISEVNRSAATLAAMNYYGIS